MSIFKCKMCGGALEIGGGETVATCEYCGTQQTLPRLDDDRRVNLYDRANHFRRSNEFDKAMGIYEQILTEDGSDAEAYWSLVLCRYGIEYVEDPASHKRIPTVNRAQFTSIFDDDNYKSALQYADASQRVIYEQEAKAINEIQKGILAISQQEEPFDVFICYKETDANGRRTPDSVLANDLYHQLTQEGFKVFFARITLEDNLGSAYEPYIFAALNSAKVMVVLGTKPEYFNAVWVKNEWSRYLSLIKQGQKKMLIPAYKDMDPYDLPEEFSHLQAQDMSKLGFMQDLIRGIKKIAQSDEPKQTVIKETVVTGGNASAASTASLLKRAFMFLEDGEWSSAAEYCEKVLDIDPETAQAYLGKLMAELQVRRQEDLKNCAEPFDGLNNYKKAIRFADEKLRKTLEGYIEYNRLERRYNEALKRKQNAKNEEAFRSAADAFREIEGFKDSAALAAQCVELAEKARLYALYDEAMSLKRNVRLESGLKNAAKIFSELGDFKDSATQAAECMELAEKVRQDRLHRPYDEAMSAKRSARSETGFKEAAKKFLALGDLEDSAMQAAQCLELAEEARRNGIYVAAMRQISDKSVSACQEAIVMLTPISEWRDAAERIEECKRIIEELEIQEEAKRLERERKAEEERLERERVVKQNKKIAIMATLIVVVIIAFLIVLDTVIIPNGKYNGAVALMEAGQYEEAVTIFEKLGDYKDSADKIDACELAMLEVGDYAYFGSYEQDNDTSNDKEAIEWLVLDIEDGRALLISKYGLDCQRYNEERTDVTWGDCTLRKWLNDEFLNAAFSVKEQALVATATVSADENPNYDTDPGQPTKDKVFLLSASEAEVLIKSDRVWVCQPTEYAEAKGAFVGDVDWEDYEGNIVETDKLCPWWLRTSGSSNTSASYVVGGVEDDGVPVDASIVAVRPAIWVQIGE